jgi:hypothetical protein
MHSSTHVDLHTYIHVHTHVNAHTHTHTHTCMGLSKEGRKSPGLWDGKKGWALEG